MYRPEELSEHSASFVYTPFTALLVAPLAYRQVTPAQAAHVASLINHVLAVVAFGFLVLVITGGGRPALGEGLLYALHFVVFYPLAKAMQLTQASVWIFFFLTASGFLLARGRHTASGVALALGVSIKPHLIVIPLLLAVLPQFPRRMIYSCAAGLLATGVASLWYAGMSDTRAYLFETLPTLAAGYAYFPNQSAGGILLRSFTPQNPAVFNLSVSVPWVKVAAVVYALALLGLTGLAFRSRRVAEHEDTALLGYSAAVIAATLASPVLWEHHFTALMLPLATVVRHLRAHPHRRTRVLDAGMLVSFLLIAVFIDTRYLHGWPIALLSGFQHYGGLLLLACVAWLMRRVDG